MYINLNKIVCCYFRQNIESAVEKFSPKQIAHQSLDEGMTTEDNIKPTSAAIPLTNPGNKNLFCLFDKNGNLFYL